MKGRGLSGKVRWAGIGLVIVTLLSEAAFAQVLGPRIARNLQVSLTRAMDQCSAPTLTIVGGQNLPLGGCLQQNTATDSSLNLIRGQILVTDRGKIALVASGFTLGDELRVQLRLRITRPVQTKQTLGSKRQVTFPDATIRCPAAPQAFLANLRGSIAQTTDFGACLQANLGAIGLLNSSERVNIEIVDAALVNANTDQVVAVPGVLR